MSLTNEFTFYNWAKSMKSIITIELSQWNHLLQEINMVMGEEGEEDNSSSSVSDFPRPTGREYILRTFAPRPAPYSKSLPQRMYVNITEGHEFRLAGAFSQDTVFQWIWSMYYLNNLLDTEISLLAFKTHRKKKCIF